MVKVWMQLFRDIQKVVVFAGLVSEDAASLTRLQGDNNYVLARKDGHCGWFLARIPFLSVNVTLVLHQVRRGVATHGTKVSGESTHERRLFGRFVSTVVMMVKVVVMMW